MSGRWEREFLSLAGIYLACRLRAMGGEVECPWPAGDLAYSLLGMMDYGAEMRLVCREVRP